ncbi:acyl-CoA thioesterase [Alkalicoccus chagannorensis]|uniref:acyl-CoA thioesterase n=1 Tax=Alkalicoccus chagannorensis TaxID=427072 RepID=UPI0004068CB1|nr:thioesterase family protein [Alkalicoccus chagannorensis]
MGMPAYIQNPAEWQEGFTFFDHARVRFSETDAFGHVNNTVAFVYFEQARINYFQSLGLMQDWMEGESIIVTGDLQCDYHRQVTFGEALTIGVKTASVGRTSIDVHYMVTNEKQELCMTGRGRIVQIHKQTGQSHPWSDAVSAKLQA